MMIKDRLAEIAEKVAKKQAQLNYSLSELRRDMAVAIVDAIGDVKDWSKPVKENPDAWNVEICATEGLEGISRLTKALRGEIADVHIAFEEIFSDLGVAANELEAKVFSCERHSKSDPSIRQAVLALTDGKCTYCDVELIDGGQASNSFVVEHVVPASKGGPDNLVNYVPACQSCNISKRDGHVLDFIKRRQGGNVTTLPTLPKREAAE